jgi:hypothetical protein
MSHPRLTERDAGAAQSFDYGLEFLDRAVVTDSSQNPFGVFWCCVGEHVKHATGGPDPAHGSQDLVGVGAAIRCPQSGDRL